MASISKEQIAHDLTMVYLSNRYGIDVSGSVSVSEGEGCGSVTTEKFPLASEIKYTWVKTEEKGFLGFKKRVPVEDGYESDDTISNLIAEYYDTYSRILSQLEQY